MSSPQHRAVVRCCASCEWIFRRTEEDATCPKCRFGSYGARYVHGQACYTYELTQQPWADRKMKEFQMKLMAEIERDAPKAIARHNPLFLDASDR